MNPKFLIEHLHIFWIIKPILQKTEETIITLESPHPSLHTFNILHVSFSCSYAFSRVDITALSCSLNIGIAFSLSLKSSQIQFQGCIMPCGYAFSIIYLNIHSMLHIQAVSNFYTIERKLRLTSLWENLCISEYCFRMDSKKRNCRVSRGTDGLHSNIT